MSRDSEWLHFCNHVTYRKLFHNIQYDSCLMWHKKWQKYLGTSHCHVIEQSRDRTVTWRNIHTSHKFGLFEFWQYRCYPLGGWSKSALGWIRIKIRIIIISWIGSYCRSFGSFRKSVEITIIYFKYKGVKS